MNPLNAFRKIDFVILSRILCSFGGTQCIKQKSTPIKMLLNHRRFQGKGVVNEGSEYCAGKRAID